MKHALDTLRVTNPARERLAIARKRTLRRRPVMAARSVWSECQSRIIELRKHRNSRLGLHFGIGGGGTVMYIVRRGLGTMQAKYMEAGPESMSRAKTQKGIQRSWESPHRPCYKNRKRM